MSWNKVTQMTGGVPAGTQDYNAQNLHILAALLLAKQGILHLTEWTTLTVPAIAAGVSIMHGGNLYTNENSDLAITDPGVANGRVYIQISDAGGGTLDVEFTNSAAGFSWNNVYQGFYNIGGDQLMPYVLYKTASGYRKFDLSFSENKFDITAKLNVPKYVSATWDMNANATITVAHGLDSSTSELIRSMAASISGVAAGSVSNLSGGSDAADPLLLRGAVILSSSISGFSCFRRTGGAFASPTYATATLTVNYILHV